MHDRARISSYIDKAEPDILSGELEEVHDQTTVLGLQPRDVWVRDAASHRLSSQTWPNLPILVIEIRGICWEQGRDDPAACVSTRIICWRKEG